MDELDTTEEQLIGSRLKKAREEANLTIVDIASSLNLTKSTIIYLESNNYSSSRRDVFHRGYLRAYAKLLGLPPDDLVNSYCDIVGSEEIIVKSNLSIDNSDDLIEKQTSNRVLSFFSEHVKSISIVGVLLLIVLVGVWWHNKFYYTTNDSVFLTKDVNFVKYAFDEE